MEDLFRKNQANVRVAKLSGSDRLAFWLVAVGVFLFVVILVFTWFNYRNFTKDELIHFAPVNTIVYFSAHNSFWPWSEEVLSQLPYDTLFLNTEQDFAQKLLPLSLQTAHVKFLIDDQLEQVWLFKLAKAADENTFASDLSGFKIYNNKIVVVGSVEALKKVDEVVQGQIFSLASQIKISQAPVNLYINAENLRTFLNYQSSGQYKILSQLLNQDLYLKFYKNNNVWQIDFNQNISEEKISNQRLVTKLPTDFSIFISNVNLSDLFNQWARADKSLAKTFAQTQKIYQQVFDFDLSFVSREILDNPADVIIFSQNDSALGVDYILAMNQPSSSGIQSFQELVKVILAQKLPQKTIRYLPDGSSVTELSANTEAWQWQTSQIEGSEVHYITEPELNFSIYYMFRDDKLLISGTQERLASFLSNSEINIDDYKSQCLASIFEGSYVIFAKNSQILELSQFLPTGSVVVGQKLGCISDF